MTTKRELGSWVDCDYCEKPDDECDYHTHWSDGYVETEYCTPRLTAWGRVRRMLGWEIGEGE